ncbi:hypothetical protein CVU37_01705 [candidate division BRC1 bacterium HGW-BRC1-1]|nr:MAG: hypothetical protein CVU37_01705 [candidate division BRC1 bacterium HGW-BRC1-1]
MTKHLMAISAAAMLVLPVLTGCEKHSTTGPAAMGSETTMTLEAQSTQVEGAPPAAAAAPEVVATPIASDAGVVVETTTTTTTIAP